MYTAQNIWRYGNIDVRYDQNVDGGGMLMTPSIVTFINDYFGGRRFGTVFEWCSGPGFIGFALLAEGICNSLCLADINPAAIECVKKTVAESRLESRVRSYVSDNLASVPRFERFDLVVGNPPAFCAMNPAHPLYEDTATALISSDPDWRIRAGFYSQIGTYLNPGAHTLIHEVEPHRREVFMIDRTIPFELRPEMPASVFRQMIEGGGLAYIETVPVWTAPWPPGHETWVQIAQKPL